MGNNVYRDSVDSRWEYIYTDEPANTYKQMVNIFGDTLDQVQQTPPLLGQKPCASTALVMLALGRVRLVIACICIKRLGVIFNH